MHQILRWLLYIATAWNNSKLFVFVPTDSFLMILDGLKLGSLYRLHQNF